MKKQRPNDRAMKLTRFEFQEPNVPMNHFKFKLRSSKVLMKKRVLFDARTAPKHQEIYARILAVVEEAERRGLVQQDPAWRAIAMVVRMNEPAAALLKRLGTEGQKPHRTES